MTVVTLLRFAPADQEAKPQQRPPEFAVRSLAN